MSDTSTPVVPSTPLERYTQQVRRQRVVYVAVVAVVVVVLGVVAAVAWSRGEVNNTSLHTVDTAPAALPIAAPVQTPKPAWQSSDRVAIGAPQYRGTVVVFDRHTVRGLDARSGDETWSYTRSNRTVCTAAQLGGTTIAVYEVGGNCDEVTAVASGTGERRWTRTLDMDGMPVDGQPTFLTSTQGGFNTFVVTTPTVIYALDPASGNNRWTYTHFGCTILGTAIGATGALISQNCTQPRCGKLKFCGRGPQLMLRNAYDARDDKSETNPDKIVWNLMGNGDRPVSGDAPVLAYDAVRGRLDQFDGKTGAARGSTPVALEPGTTDAVVAAPTNGVVIVWLGGVTYAIRDGVAEPLWTARTPAAPTVVANSGEDVPTLATARITASTDTGVRLLDGNDGNTAQQFPLPAPAADSRIYPLGAGFLVAGPDRTLAYS